MTAPHYADDNVTLYAGDCLDVLKTLADNSIDAVVTDPPYGLEFMGKDWDKFGATVEASTDTDWGRTLPFAGGGNRVRYGAPGLPFQSWCELWATECLRVLKPGGHMLAFGGSRTHHRLICAIEDSGFEIRDAICWVFGSGFPKSLNVSAALDRIVPSDARCACAPRSTRTAPSSQSGYPSCRGSDDGQLPWRLDSGLDDVPSQDGVPAHTLSDQHADGQGPELANTCADEAIGHPASAGSSRQSGHPLEDSHSGASAQFGTQTSTSGVPVLGHHRTQNHTQHTSDSADDSASAYSPNKYMACSECGKVVVPQGLGTALKPAMEIISVARKPIQAGTVAANVQAWGTGALNVDGCRVAVSDADRAAVEGREWVADNLDRTAYGKFDGDGKRRAIDYAPAGRWPANVVLDGDMADELDKQSGISTASAAATSRPMQRQDNNVYGKGLGSIGPDNTYSDSGGASRFFPTFKYTAKAPGTERPTADGVCHPTVKPLDLMRWLVRLVTPPGGVVLDPFAGSGTTGEAAIHEHKRAILIEREPSYLPLIVARLSKPMAIGFDFDTEVGA